jgi:putative transposase
MHTTVYQEADGSAWSATNHLSRWVLRRDEFDLEDIRIVRTPIQVPEANGIAERFVRTARSECLDWLLILSVRYLEGALTLFTDHYNGWRRHRSLDLAPPNGRPSAATWTETRPITLKRRDRLGGLLHEYERAA